MSTTGTYIWTRLRRELAEKGWRGVLAQYGGVRGILRGLRLTLRSAWNDALLNWTGRLAQSNLYIRLFREPIARRFNRMYFLLRNHTFDRTEFMGKPIMKYPTDLWIYQEILFERKPDVIIETGVFLAGSTFYFSKLCTLMGKGRIIAIDQTLDHVDPDVRRLANVTLIEGSSRDPAVIEKIRRLIQPGEQVMAILDADHTPEHVAPEMECIAPLVTPGQYLVVEDGIISRVYPGVWKSKGPLGAIRTFLRTHPEFVTDHFRERFLLSHSPNGYLLKQDPARPATLPFRNAEDCYRPYRLWLWGVSSEASWRPRLNQGRISGAKSTPPPS